MGLGREPGLKNGFKEQEEDLLNDAVLERGFVGFEKGLELAFGDQTGDGSIVWGSNEEMSLHAPHEKAVHDRILEGEEVVEGWRLNGVSRRKGTGVVGAGTLVG